MILEHALLHVRFDEESAFEATMAEAKPLVAASPGFLGIEVRPATEKPGLYLLLVAGNPLQIIVMVFVNQCIMNNDRPCFTDSTTLCPLLTISGTNCD